jgi:hypothetical protein
MYHNTLNEALEAAGESLVSLWPIGFNIGYGETGRCVVNGTFISVYRDTRGLYEEAISYASKCNDFQLIVKDN